MNRGQAITMDAMLAAIVFLLLATASEYYLVNSETSSLKEQRMNQAGYNTLAMMRRDAVLLSGNSTLIESRLASYTPSNYEIELSVDEVRFINGSQMTLSSRKYGSFQGGNYRGYASTLSYNNGGYYVISIRIGLK